MIQQILQVKSTQSHRHGLYFKSGVLSRNKGFPCFILEVQKEAGLVLTAAGQGTKAQAGPAGAKAVVCSN